MERYKSIFKEASGKLWYLGFRSNPQLRNGGYYVAYGQLSKSEAKKKETNVAYGGVSLTPFMDELEYLQAIEDVEHKGFNVR